MMPFRRTKIIATMGPACSDPAIVSALIEAGVNVFRINFSHATHDEFERWIGIVRSCEARTGTTVAVLADLQGPKLRLGDLAGHKPVVLRDGATLEITTSPIAGTIERVSTTYANLPRDVKSGDRILIDDGRLELRVATVKDSTVTTTVVHGGTLGERKGMNLPNVAVSAPSLTEKDRDDLRVALRAGADFVALSFVRSAQDVVDARNAVREANADTPIVAKIEKPEAVDHLDDILSVSDAVMVARGDLGVEMAPELVPTLQKEIILRARFHLIPVITATQMLESMITAARPTRAEASDVANAIIDGSDALMLSGETAAGAYPVEAVSTMARIALEVERSFPPPDRRRRRVESDSHAISHAAVYITESIDVKAIAAFTRTGFSARIVSIDRPRVPIYAFVPDQRVARRLSLDWAVQPCVIDFAKSTDDLMQAVEAELLRIGAVAKQEAVVVVGGTPMGVPGRTNFLKITRAGETTAADTS